MKLIVGLGNPGTKYIHTRHNIGFRVVYALSRRYQARFKHRLFQKSEVAQAGISGENVQLVKPLTYMNLSGICVASYVRKNNIPFENLIIICDDVNLPLGNIRLRRRGSAGGHNGLESVIKSLRTEEFPRLRLGVGPDKAIDDLADFVLSDFEKSEIEHTDSMIDNAADACEDWLKNGIDETMQKFNN